ncbi:hypothetical protein KBK19_12150 [Microvirga sp. STR05]|uniref:Uncharacterized protein n=1 Tax=Hymenobacter duratus TaxID=2771356 RepID=A0ABR8JJL1_9BACT|nr:hypothetical protein [Hymenobacter duratus]MBD2715788.1 hypothetical protein [Hymenobacter duratus]MBR7950699.1 hypothetical protein [Microvirga sp. STR05]
MNSFKAFLTHFNRFSYFFVGFCFVFSLGCAAYFVFARTPRFLFAIKNDLLENPQLMRLIGEEEGYNLWYSGEETPNQTFRVTIHGQCPEASITICGTYRGEAYSVTDTVVVKCL